jgi:uncharacterized protein involved in exopolysaccharide biosynthesis
MLDPRINAVLQNSAVLSAQPTDPASVQNQIQILTSRDIAAEVIANLKLYDDPEFAGAGLFSHEAPSADDVIDTFERHLTVSAVGLSTTFTIAFASRDPDKAAAIANAIANAYLQDAVNTQNAASRNTTDFLLSRIHTLAHQVQQAESAVQQYKAVNNLTDTGTGNSLVDEQLIGVNTALIAAKSDLAEKQANASHINTMLSGGQVGDVSQVVASPLMVQLRTQEADILQKEAESQDDRHRIPEAQSGSQDRRGSAAHRRLRCQRCVCGAGQCRLAAIQPRSVAEEGNGRRPGARASAGAGSQCRIHAHHV